MKKNGKNRIYLLLGLCAAVFAAFLGRLVWMQFAMAEHYAQKLAEASHSSYTVTLPAARGSITDSIGRILVQDETEYDLYLCVPAPPGTRMQDTLDTLQQLDLGGRDVETQLAAFSSAVSSGELLLAEALSESDRAALLERGLPQSGAVRLAARGVRTAADGALAPQILGGTGPMSTEQWAARRETGLAMDAVIGQWGLEAAWDTALRGTAGVLSVCTERGSGARTEQVVQEPQPGETLRLFLNADLQRTLRDALQAQITALNTEKPAGQGREACAGAVAAADVQTGGILAAVSLPDYDLTRWRQDYAALCDDPDAPLLNRVLNGLYAPGSAFKPAVAAAALAAGIVSPQSTVACTGRYAYYAGYQPRCLQLNHAGSISLAAALRYSCNIYFYDVGRRTGLDTISAAAALLGLGTPTGAELPEAAGRLSWQSDENNQAGLTLMAAIGQGNTAVTPLQLVSYACALARDGQRPALHFAQSTTAADGTVTWQYTPQILSSAPGGAQTFAAIRQGMTEMAQTLRVLRESPVALACKTGSPQRAETAPDGSRYTNAVLIGYAPADNPRLAVAVVIEYGGGGANAAPVMRAAADWLAAGGMG